MRQLLAESERVDELDTTFVAAVARVEHLLSKLVRETSQLPPLEPAEVVAVGALVWPRFTSVFRAFEETAAEIPLEEHDAHRRYARERLHPFLLQAPFILRAYSKPLGYAGDHGVVAQMLACSCEGPTLVGQLVHGWCVRQAFPASLRQRVAMLVEHLRRERRRMPSDRALRVLSVGCGPAAEVARYIREEPAAELTTFDLLDFDQAALDQAAVDLARATAETRRAPRLSFVQMSVDQILEKAVGLRQDYAPQSFDVIYCAGMFDYLSDRTCTRLVKHFEEWLAPGGLALATNVHAASPMRSFMEYLLDWHLIYRDEARLRGIAPHAAVTTDAQGMSLSLEIRAKSTP